MVMVVAVMIVEVMVVVMVIVVVMATNNTTDVRWNRTSVVAAGYRSCAPIRQ